MSRLVTTIIILTLVLVIMITGIGFIEQCNQKFNKLYNKTNGYITQSQFEDASSSVSQMIINLKKERKKLMMFSDHDTIESLSAKLNKTLSYIESKEKALASAELSEARDIMSAIYGTQQLSVENIL